ncbi:MAG: lycopene cyclase domain-containing protein [Actinobacteria bacterium]|nr:lycopene cyclase domain-containing protein [Actinomycetota bacterium]
MPEYTLATLGAMLVAVVVDLRVLRTRLLTQRTFLLSLGIMFFFQIFVDGWLTKLSSPIVIYAAEHASGIRVFFDSPIEDFGFGFALILGVCSVWDALAARDARRGGRP